MTAKIKYEEQQIQIKENLDLLKQKLKNHQLDFSKKSTNWGYVGDLEFILNHLKEINQFLK